MGLCLPEGLLNFLHNTNDKNVTVCVNVNSLAAPSIHTFSLTCMSTRAHVSSQEHVLTQPCLQGLRITSRCMFTSALSHSDSLVFSHRQMRCPEQTRLDWLSTLV